MTEDLHALLWRLGSRIGQRMPRAVLGYNSWGGFASASHFHLHILTETDLPILLPPWLLNGGTEDYPAVCQVFEDAAASWRLLSWLNENDFAYNLLFKGGRIFVFPRQLQSKVPRPRWSNGLAWLELSGYALVDSELALQSLTEQDIREALSSVGVVAPVRGDSG